MSIFGDLWLPERAERAVVDTLHRWEVTYLSEIERQRPELDVGNLPRIKRYTTRSEFDSLPGDELLPLVVVVSPGTADEPTKLGGKYRASWDVAVVILVSAREEVRRVASYYAAALRAALVQHPSLGGQASGCDWVGERYDVLDSTDERTLAAVRMLFEVGQDDVLDPRGGPRDPSEPPDSAHADWPTVDSHDIDVQPYTLEGAGA